MPLSSSAAPIETVTRRRCRTDLERLVCEQPAKALGARGERSIVTDLGRDHDELLAAPAVDAVRRTKARAKPVVHGHQQCVAGRVPVPVVHVPEPVGVEEEDSGRLGAAADPRLLGRERLLERVPVQRARERVRARPRPLPPELGERTVAGSERDQAPASAMTRPTTARTGVASTAVGTETSRGSASSDSSFYWMSVSILNIGMYMAITIVPTMTPTPIISTGSMIEVSDWMLESTSSS